MKRFKFLLNGKMVARTRNASKQTDIEGNKQPPPVKVIPIKKKPKTPKTLTLEDAIKYINSLANSDNTKKIWINNLANIVFFQLDPHDVVNSNLTNEEVIERNKDFDLLPLLTSFDDLVELIETRIKNKTNGQPIAIDTIKQYYNVVCRLAQKGGVLKISKELKNKYTEKFREFHKKSNENRDKTEAKKGNLEHPDFTWDYIKANYQQFIDETAFTNTEKGKKDIRNAALLGMYILQLPRRVEDYELLQYYSKLPNEKQMQNKNILLLNKNEARIYLDKFKTRWWVRGKKKEKSELLPRYVKDLNPVLADLLRDYVKKWGIKDNAKEKTQDNFVFFKETGLQNERLATGGFSSYITSVMKQVFKKKKLSVNTLRHAWNTWLAQHFNEFTDTQIKEFAVDVGDTPKNMPTHLRYRISNAGNKEMAKTEIIGDVEARQKLVDMIVDDAEDEGSVGDADEVKSPVVVPIVNEDILDRLVALEREKWALILGMMKKN